MTLRTITSCLRYIAVKQGYPTNISIHECVNSHAHPNVKAGIEMPIEGIWRQYELTRLLDYLRAVRATDARKVGPQLMALAVTCAYVSDTHLQDTENLQYVWARRWTRKIHREKERRNDTTAN